MKDYMTVLEPPPFGAPPEAADNANHPASDDKWWQESALFTWGDAEHQFGGEIRLGMHVNQGVANLYTWTVRGEDLIDRRLVIDQPLPPGGILNADIAGASVRTLEPLCRYQLSLDHGDLSLRLLWRNFRHPLTMGYNVGRATIANGHYNAMGEVTGTGRYRGATFDVCAVGFSDHSWGVRKTHLPASRALFCVFGEDFYITAIPVSTGQSRMMVGYVFKDGILGRLASTCEMGYRFRDDWITPAGCDARLVDDQGREFHVTGWTFGPSSTQTMGHGKYVTHAAAGFRCADRRGSGILESSQFKGMPPSIAALGLDPGSWWVNEDAD
jgi:hypothetical protein